MVCMDKQKKNSCEHTNHGKKQKQNEKKKTSTNDLTLVSAKKCFIF